MGCSVYDFRRRCRIRILHCPRRRGAKNALWRVLVYHSLLPNTSVSTKPMATETSVTTKPKCNTSCHSHWILPLIHLHHLHPHKAPPWTTPPTARSPTPKIRRAFWLSPQTFRSRSSTTCFRISVPKTLDKRCYVKMYPPAPTPDIRLANVCGRALFRNNLGAHASVTIHRPPQVALPRTRRLSDQFPIALRLILQPSRTPRPRTRSLPNNPSVRSLTVAGMGLLITLFLAMGLRFRTSRRWQAW